VNHTVVTGSGVDPSEVEKLRVMVYLHCPSDASPEEASKWLRSQMPHLPREVVDAAVELHLWDYILQVWRDGSLPQGELPCEAS